MVSLKTFKEIASSFPEVEELPHFENTSFRVRKKIFATLSEKDKRACVKFSLVDQSTFGSFDKTAVYAVPNKWGKLGWTYVELGKVKKETLTDILTTAYCQVAPQRLSRDLQNDATSLK